MNCVTKVREQEMDGTNTKDIKRNILALKDIVRTNCVTKVTDQQM